MNRHMPRRNGEATFCFSLTCEGGKNMGSNPRRCGHASTSRFPTSNHSKLCCHSNHHCSRRLVSSYPTLIIIRPYHDRSVKLEEENRTFLWKANLIGWFIL
ncbi:hypothetical protein MPTK1_5g19540 [Marchantia polymorpha subsp. ruderalis]|uniref:Uncharacterized protein n=2 Tax=Marchantia polymorpha TaxID=3197 RepID=A0AAF6BK43_MARPO|nr:hypothetical protein MARPO_0134s0012 [Marchantia polymorpha]BBN12377.1 hypothetical protein Mp_5g19540 [Marchantia polymorpha subsp. ruderalis]|eukprot:PTQ29800.1 hypothetical protein MARPO_0134s0012 [Marchantia polymorpha]